MLFDMVTKNRYRKSIRLHEYDYASSGMYFVTICTYEKQCLFGDIVDEKMQLNKFGEIAYHEWIQSQQIRDEIKLDKFVIMPNHIHGIVKIAPVGANGCSPKCSPMNVNGNNPMLVNGYSPPENNRFAQVDDRVTMANSRSPLRGMKQKSISSLIAGYKSTVTKQINKLRNMQRVPIWQRNYYEHIIRNAISLNKIREYITNNPVKWQYDCYNCVDTRFSNQGG